MRQVIESQFKIVNKDSHEVPFTLNPVQIKFLESMTGRDLILKARQEGFSSLILALFSLDFLFKPNSRSVCVSHEASATVKLLDKVKHYIEPLGLNLKYNSRNEMYNDQINSIFYIGTARATAFGRGDTINNLHASECAFYDHADELMTGLLQSVPKDGRVFIETTANGMGNYYHREWQKAINNESSFTPHFFSWKEDPEYRLKNLENWKPSAEERQYMLDFGLDIEQMLWRKKKMMEFKNEDAFNQEYPITSDVAFISSGNPSFDMHSLDWYMKNKKQPIRCGNLVGTKTHLTLEETSKGYLKIWEMPKDRDSYVIGADVAESHDFSVAQVINARTMEQVAVWHGRIPADSFAKELERLAYFYNTALLGVERNNQGIATLVVLNQLYYPMLFFREDVSDLGESSASKLGWETNTKTRPIMITDLGMFIRNRDLKINDEDTIKELMTFAKNAKGKDEAQAGCFDDRVMSLAVAGQMYRRSAGNVTKNGIVNVFDNVKMYENDFGGDIGAFSAY